MTRVKKQQKKDRNNRRFSSVLMCGLVLSGVILPSAIVLAETVNKSATEQVKPATEQANAPQASTEVSKETTPSSVAPTTVPVASTETTEASKIEATPVAKSSVNVTTIGQNDKATTGSVKIIYRVGETGKILYTRVVSGNIGERFNIETPIDVKGYFPDITNPNTSIVSGGNPDEAVVAELGSKLLFSGDFDELNRTVTFNFYAPNAIVDVKYIDDTTGKELETRHTEGPVHSTPTGFDYDNILKNYVSDGYELVSSDYNAADPFYTGQKDIAYTVHLKHVIDIQPESKDIARVINFNDEDGNAVSVRKTQLVTFNRATEYDRVTSKVTTTPWDKASYTFEAVDAPSVDGYDVKPGAKAQAETITPASQSTVFNYSYTTKTADEKGTVTFKYVDAKSNKLQEPKMVTGTVGDAYSEKAPTIKGYKLDTDKSDATKSGKFTKLGQTYYFVYNAETPTPDPDPNAKLRGVLKATIKDAKTYLDNTKYKEAYVNKLDTAIKAGEKALQGYPAPSKDLLEKISSFFSSKSDSSDVDKIFQSNIDSINKAVKDVKANPVAPTPSKQDGVIRISMYNEKTQVRIGYTEVKGHIGDSYTLDPKL